MFADIRFAARQLLKNPTFSAVAVLVLTLAIGANIIVFSLIHPLLLEPLAFPESERLVRIFGVEKGAGRDQQRVTEAQARALRQELDGVEISAAYNMGLAVTDSEKPLNPLMRRISHRHFEIFGVGLVLGRPFLAEEHTEGAKVALLNEGFWLARYGGDPDIVGKTIELAGEAHEIVGVAPATFIQPGFPQAPVLFLPMAENADSFERTNVVTVARLGEGMSRAELDHRLGELSRQLAQQYPDQLRDHSLRAVSLHESVVGGMRPPLMMLFVAVALVLLVACGNIANLLLARALSRQREIAVRLALGAGRLQLIRQLLIESLLLAFIGASFGLLIAAWGIGPLVSMAPTNLQVPRMDEVTVDGEIVGFTIGLATLTAVIFGLFPMAQLAGEPSRKLSAGAVRATGGNGRLRRSLVVAEIALSTVLLIAAGLMVRSLMHWRATEPGFEPAGLLAGRTGARGPGLDTPDRFEPFHRQVLENIAAIPGVEKAGACQFLPMFAAGFGNAVPVSADAAEAPENWPRGVTLAATPGFFDAFGQRLLAGRPFLDTDRAGAPPVAVISRGLAETMWGEAGTAVGQDLWLDEGGRHSVRVVGVAADLRGLARAPESPSLVFLPLAQRPTSNMTFLARSELPQDQLRPAIEEAIWSISRDVPVYSFRDLETLLRDLEWQPRFVMQLLTGFALLALVLAATGLYGVLAYSVAERRREIGVRLAVGADRLDIVRMVQRDAVRLAAIGLGFGAAGALLLSRGLQNLLLGVSATDPVTFAFVIAVLATVTAFASWLPAWRASHVDPVDALKTD